MNTQPGTLNLFPGENGSGLDDEIPPDVKAAIEIVTGGLSGDLLEGTPLDKRQIPNSQENWQNGLLKRHEAEKARPEYSGYEIHCLDLANDNDAKKLEEIMNRVSVSGSKAQIEQTPVKIMGDSKAPKGYRAITIVKVWQVKMALPPNLDRPVFAQTSSST